MKEFKIEIKEILSKLLVVKADNEADAIRKVKYMYEAEKIVLDSENFIDNEITVIDYER